MTGKRPCYRYGELTFVAGDSFIAVYDGDTAPPPYGEGGADIPRAMVAYPRSIKRCHLDQRTFEMIVLGLLDEVTSPV